MHLNYINFLKFANPRIVIKNAQYAKSLFEKLSTLCLTKSGYLF